MTRSQKLSITIMVVVMVVLLPLVSYYYTRSAQSIWDKRKVRPYTALTHTGEPFSSRQLEGKPHVASFLYSECTSPYCDSVLARMQAVADEFRDDTDLHLLTFTIDPEMDHGERLAGWAGHYVDSFPQWQFLTGDPDSIRHIVEGSYFVTKIRWREAHIAGLKASPKLVLIGHDGLIKGFYGAEGGRDMKKLTEAIRKQLAETPKPEAQ
jgi:protein SCO1